MRLGALMGCYFQGMFHFKKADLDDWLLFTSYEFFDMNRDFPVWDLAEKLCDGVYEPRPYMRGYYKGVFESAGKRDYYLTRPYQAGGTLAAERPVIDTFADTLGAQVIVWVRGPEVLKDVGKGDAVAVRPGPAWDNHGFWKLANRDVWIVGTTPERQWRAYTELVSIGANVTHVLITYSWIQSLSRSGVIQKTDPYYRTHTREERTRVELNTMNLQSVDRFWRMVCPEKNG